MRCLILGATGQIGSHFDRACEDRGWPRLGTRYTCLSGEQIPLDLRDIDQVGELLADYQPDVAILAAGVSSPGFAELYPAQCRPVQQAVRALAVQIANQGGRLVSLSSGDIFGSCSTARREDDPTAASGVWAEGHLETEVAIRELLPDRHLIVRTGWVFGPELRRRSVVGTWMKKLTRQEPIEAATDRQGQPTYGPDLAETVLDLVAREVSGTIHVVGPDRHTEYALARLVAHVNGFDVDLVQGVREGTGGRVDPRPDRVWLDRSRVRSILGSVSIRDTAAGLRAMRSPTRMAHVA